MRILWLKLRCDYFTEMRQQIKSNSVCRMLRCLTNERSNFSFAVARYKISFQVYNKIACHSIPSSCVPSTCLYLVTSFKESKKTNKQKKVKAPLIYPSSEWLQHHSTHENGRRRERAMGRGSMKLLICYLQIVWIKVGCIHNGSVHIAEEVNT